MPAIEGPGRRLIARLRSGDVSALEELYEAHYDELCAFATPLTGSAAGAEEIVEDVFVRVWQNRRQLAVRSSLRAYLFGAVRRQALLQHRTAANRDRLLGEALGRGERPGVAGVAPTPGEELEAAELAARFRTAILALPDRPREAFQLRKGHGLSIAEIAETMGISESTVEKHLARAMAELRAVLDRWRAGG